MSDKIKRAFGLALRGYAGIIKESGLIIFIYIMGTRITVKIRTENDYADPDLYMTIINEYLPIKADKLSLRLDTYKSWSKKRYYWVIADQYFNKQVKELIGC